MKRKAKRIAKAVQIVSAAKAKGRLADYREVEDALMGRPLFPEAVVEAAVVLESSALTDRGRKRLINVAKHVAGAYLKDAGFTPLKEQSGYVLKDLSVRSYEEIKLVFGPTTQAEKDMHDALDLIADVMMGRPYFNEIDFNADGFDGEFGSLEDREINEVIAQFTKNYKTVGGGKVRNVGLRTPGYDEKARNEADRRNPLKFSLLKSTSGKRHHVVIFGKLYSFGKKKAATAS